MHLSPWEKESDKWKSKQGKVASRRRKREVWTFFWVQKVGMVGHCQSFCYSSNTRNTLTQLKLQNTHTHTHTFKPQALPLNQLHNDLCPNSRCPLRRYERWPSKNSLSFFSLSPSLLTHSPLHFLYLAAVAMAMDGLRCKCNSSSMKVLWFFWSYHMDLSDYYERHC